MSPTACHSVASTREQDLQVCDSNWNNYYQLPNSGWVCAQVPLHQTLCHHVAQVPLRQTLCHHLAHMSLSGWLGTGDAAGVILVYDLGDRRSLARLPKWAAEVARAGSFQAPFTEELAARNIGGLPVPVLVRYCNSGRGVKGQ